MDLLKKQNWWVWLIILLLGSNLIKNIVLGVLLNVFDKEQWYAKWWVWVLGIVLLVIPFLIMMIIFNTQIQIANAAKLKVPGEEIYGSNYFWILGVIVPFLGWAVLSIMMFYLTIMILVHLYNGEGEKCLN